MSWSRAGSMSKASGRTTPFSGRKAPEPAINAMDLESATAHVCHPGLIVLVILVCISSRKSSHGLIETFSLVQVT